MNFLQVGRMNMTAVYPGSLASVFHHMALGELMDALRPAEYWESHAGRGGGVAQEMGGGAALFDLIGAGTSSHGGKVALDALRMNPFLRAAWHGAAQKKIAGTAALAHTLLAPTARRLLFCDSEAPALQQISHLAGTSPLFECVQDDGVAILRGAALILPEPWSASTLAYLCPPDALAATDAGISALELWCELANRRILTLLAYEFTGSADQAAQQQARRRALEKSLLARRGAQQFEATLRADGSGFGLLAMNIPSTVCDRLHNVLRLLEGACDQPGTIVNTFQYIRTSI